MGTKLRTGLAALALASAALISGAALAADATLPKKAVAVPPPAPVWDVAILGAVMTDYNFRGVSQSNRSWSATAAFEFQYNGPFGQLYAGIQGWSIEFPLIYGFTDPAAEIDFFGGWRKTWDKWALDLGLIYYYYPKETPVPGGVSFISNTDWVDIYAKLAYNVTDKITLGAQVFHTPSLLDTGAKGTYLAGTAKVVLPDITPGGLGWFISGELGHYFLGTTDLNHFAVTLPDYTYFNAGVGFTYKALTLDIRYHGTDLSQNQCGLLVTLTPNNTLNPASRYCNDTVIATLSFATALSALK